jgi:hypothetical protein
LSKPKEHPSINTMVFYFSNKGINFEQKSAHFSSIDSSQDFPH